MGLAFFGLTYNTAPQTRVTIFKQIHQIVFHGNGGYDWGTVYDMPIWLRRFTFNEIKTFHDEEAAKSDPKKSGQKTLIDSSGKVNTPEFLKASEEHKRPAKWK